ncbi:MAG: class I SAM-dependent methyltransferase, partial [Planctomycetaceae bacterium]|nr:class I SAM-dependent methyltransferase [Planctomycetaceae bacterium]
ILKGRRYDILERFNKIALQDIREKNVLDLGCNIASSSHLAWFYGANSVLGCEYSSNISKTALRISTALGSRIDIVVQDLGEPLNLNKKFDTIFAFSIYFHIKNKEMFAENILNNLAANGVVYFEGHERTSEKDYESLFKHFQSIELIGHNADGIHSKKYSRPFWELRR